MVTRLNYNQLEAYYVVRNICKLALTLSITLNFPIACLGNF